MSYFFLGNIDFHCIFSLENSIKLINLQLFSYTNFFNLIYTEILFKRGVHQTGFRNCLTQLKRKYWSDQFAILIICQ